MFLEDRIVCSLSRLTFFNQEYHEVDPVVNFGEGKFLDSWIVRQEVIQ